MAFERRSLQSTVTDLTEDKILGLIATGELMPYHGFSADDVAKLVAEPGDSQTVSMALDLLVSDGILSSRTPDVFWVRLLNHDEAADIVRQRNRVELQALNRLRETSSKWPFRGDVASEILGGMSRSVTAAIEAESGSHEARVASASFVRADAEFTAFLGIEARLIGSALGMQRRSDLLIAFAYATPFSSRNVEWLWSGRRTLLSHLQREDFAGAAEYAQSDYHPLVFVTFKAADHAVTSSRRSSERENHKVLV